MKHRFVYILLFALLLSGISVLIATRQGGDPVPDLSPEPSDLRFIKNEGQWEQDFDYLLRLTGGNVLLNEEGLIYSLYQLPEKAHPHGARSFGENVLKKEEDDLIRGHVLKVDFVGANPQATIQPAQRFPEYHNYFLGDDPSRWKGEVPLFGLLTYEALYPGIDLKMYGDGDNVKYDLLVAPGADPSDIRFRYTGAESLKLKDGALHIKTSVREIVEDPPLVYQEIDGRKQRVRCAYRLKGNELSFVFPKGYDPNYELVIDPTLVFSTYTGARADNWGFTATYDDAGNLYGGGIIFAVGGGITSFPVTPGAFQTIYGGGGTECTISKFSADGSSMVYATYLGGSLWDQPQSLFVNDRNELYVYGRTSSTNFPTTLGAYDRNYNGGRFDIFVTKFNAAGTQLLGSTYLGGSDSDGENGNYFNSGIPPITLQANYGDDARGEIILDDQSFCYIAAPSRSADFPTTPGALQPNRGGSQDAIVVKLTPDLTSLVFSTYLGGTGNDAAYGMKLDDQYNVYVTGGTSSANFPTTSGALYTNYRGGTVDGFISKISTNGRNLLNSTFIGTNAYDQSYFLELDEEYNVYVTGQTKGNFPVIGNVYSVPNSRQFISKLENDLSGFIYSTTFGVANAADPNISPTAFLVDRCDNVYVSGWGGSTNFAGNTRNLPTTSDAIQRNTDGSDFYMIVLERDARNLLYATYLGGNNAFGSGEHVDGGTCRFDREGIVYHAVCAGCGGFSTFPTTPGVVSTTNNSANCNLAAFKIEFDLAGIKAEFLTRDRNGDTLQFEGCPPLFANFDNQSSVTPQTRYFWDFGDGSPTATQRDPSHTFRDPGTYQVRLIIEDSASCNIRDTTFANILVYPRPTLTAGPDEIICEGDSVQVTGSGDPSVVRFQWSPAGNILNRDSSSAVVFPPNDAQYILTVTDTNGCRARDTLQISIDRSLVVDTRPDTIVCEGVTAPLYASTNGVSYAWSPGNLLIDSTNLSTIASPDTTTTFYLTVLNARGCEEIDSTRIEVFEVYTLEDTSICIGDTIQMKTNNGVSFSWRPSYNMDDPNAVSPFIWPLVDTLYIVRAVSSDGCISEKGVVVDVDPLPIADAGIPDSICVGGATQLLATGGVLFNWYPANNMDDSTRANPTVSPAQSQYYYVTVTDANYCSQDDSVLVWVDPLPTITAGPQSTICFGESIQLFASGGVSYRWAPNPTLSALDVPNPIASPTQPSLYVVSGTDDNGCTNDTTVAIDLVLPPEVDIEGENFLCVGGEIELTAEGGQRVRWSTGDTSRTIGVTPTGPTTYYATAFIGLCEGETDSITVDVNFDYPTASFDYEPTEGWAPQPVQFNNTSQNAATFLWNFGTGAKPNEEENPLFTFPHAGTWQVMMIAYSNTGCPDTAFGEVNLENVALHVPSAFTPNGDNTNDQWYVGYYGIRSLNVRVFSRWGMLIYESNDPDFRWDGTYKGGQVPEGVYVYVISGIGENELDYKRTGTVTVIR